MSALKNKAQEQGGDTIDFRVHEAVGSISLVPMFSPGMRGNEAKVVCFLECGVRERGRERVGRKGEGEEKGECCESEYEDRRKVVRL